MSDDLISREALIKQFIVSDSGRRIPEYDIDNFPITISVKDVKDIIRKAPKAFDKEKVIKEIQKEGDIAELHQLNILYDKKADDEEHFKRMQFELDRGYSIAMFRARKIVEKGGID